jgi:hypothetical protein
MAKQKRERRYEVDAELSNFHLAKAGSALTLVIYRKGEKLGRLKIGRGSLFWSGSHRQNWKRIRWYKFANEMNRLAYDNPDS